MNVIELRSEIDRLQHEEVALQHEVADLERKRDALLADPDPTRIHTVVVGDMLRSMTVDDLLASRRSRLDAARARREALQRRLPSSDELDAARREAERLLDLAASARLDAEAALEDLREVLLGVAERVPAILAALARHRAAVLRLHGHCNASGADVAGVAVVEVPERVQQLANACKFLMSACIAARPDALGVSEAADVKGKVAEAVSASLARPEAAARR